MSHQRHRFVFIGLSVTPPWDDGHAGSIRALMNALMARGHDVIVLESDVPSLTATRDLPRLPQGRVLLYASAEDLFDTHANVVASADLVVMGSCVPEGDRVGAWACRAARGRTAFYDIDTPRTMARLDAGDDAHISREVLGLYGLYLSFNGGPMLEEIERRYGAAWARPLYAGIDPEIHRPLDIDLLWDLGFMGTYAADRQLALDRLFIEVARRAPSNRYVIAGSRYPAPDPPPNVDRIVELPESEHASFFCAQRCALNVTRRAFIDRGWSPGVRLLEAASCGVPVVSDAWDGIDRFFEPEREILLACSAGDVFDRLAALDERSRGRIGEAARARVLRQHTAAHRAETLEGYTRELLDRASARRSKPALVSVDADAAE